MYDLYRIFILGGLRRQGWWSIISMISMSVSINMNNQYCCW